MMLKYSFNLNEIHDEIEMAVKAVLKSGYRTKDIYTSDEQKLVGTSQMGDLIVQKILA